MLINFRTEIIEVDIAAIITFHRNHFPAYHLRRGRVGAVGIHWNDANVAMALVVAAVIAGDA